MLIIRKNQNNDFVVSASQNRTLTNANYLFVFTHILSRETVSFYPQLIIQNNRYDKFRFIEGTVDNLSNVPPQVNFPYLGQYYYSIYQSTGSTLNPSLTQGEIETGRSVVIVDNDQEQDFFYQSFVSNNENNQNIIFLSDKEGQYVSPVVPSDTPTPTPTSTPTITPTITSTPTITPSPLDAFCVGQGFDYTPKTVVYRNGFIYVGGDFEFYQGNKIPLLVKINAQTGQPANDFFFPIPFTVSNTGIEINDIVMKSNGQMFVGGFYQFDISVYPEFQGITLVNSDGSVDYSFIPSFTPNGTILDMALTPDETGLFLVGSFTSPNNRIVKLNASDGTIDTSFVVGSGANTFIRKVLVDTDGSVFIGGNFTSWKGTSRNRFVKLTPTGDIDPTFNVGAGFNNTVWDFIIDGNYVYITGQYTTVQGVLKERICRLDKTTGALDVSWGQSLTSGQLISNVYINKNPFNNEFVIVLRQTAGLGAVYGTQQFYGRIFSIDVNGNFISAFGSQTDDTYGFADYAVPNDGDDDFVFDPTTGDIFVIGDFQYFSGEYYPSIIKLDQFGQNVKSTNYCLPPRLSPTPTNTASNTPTMTPTNTFTPTPSLTPSTVLSFIVASGATDTDACNNLSLGNTFTVYITDPGTCTSLGCYPAVNCFPCIPAEDPNYPFYLDPGQTILAGSYWLANEIAPGTPVRMLINNGITVGATFTGC